MAGRRRRTKEQIKADNQLPCGEIPPDVPKRRKLPREKIPTTQDQRIDEIVSLMLHNKWEPKKTTFELAQKWGCTLTAIAKAADRAADRIVVATGTMQRKVEHHLAELDEIKEKAMKAGQYTAAVRSVELKLKVTGVFNRWTRPDKAVLPEGTSSANPRGLPPELAQLSPPASVEEVEHFALTAGPMACPFEECRVHGKTSAPAPETVH